ncbi:MULTISPECIES: DUF6801 domain-containing protein [Streptomycetaceae]|uniref:Secreted protein n=1 Tax=Streptantibioticus cattleyicolor (strain ATCC 35852 / DSM 46488 / JCM 4925 / NBRC 14057 / NRRL 8057) TaxID=1003195 RepID=F8JUG5_STREN|nr:MULTISPECIES: DUF6801 domain-containing protein [Streptomycetaceae]AEW95587.1 secreted protein [Streptantibioticus cattleyicolor NRRL 8057 = DSM 46488]MYS60137.1 hypothetical protein [Streptomyces sp. SID5468]CCB75924.1 Secreted protein [Streptantibioticus cattleyicolor NRRL 8057 = DSM 46488]
MTGGALRWSDGARRARRPAAVAVAIALAGVLPGTGSAAGGTEPALTVAYSCATPTATADAEVTLAQSYPATGTAGHAIQPGPLTARVTLGHATAAWLPAGTVQVTATATLTAHVTQGPARADATWPGLAAPPVTVPADGDLTLAATGAVTPVTVDGTGEVAFDAGTLTLALRTQRADATATTPASVTAACTPKPGQDTRLGTVPVPPATGPSAPPTAGPSGTPATPAPSGTPAPGTAHRRHAIEVARPADDGDGLCPPAPTDPPDPARLPKPPTGAIVLPAPGAPPLPVTAGCAYVAGYANVRKLDGAALINDPHRHPALARVSMGVRRVLRLHAPPGEQPYIEYDSVAALKLPPADTTFLTYGFMPTTATMELVPDGPMTIVQTGYPFFKQPTLTTIGGYQTIRLRDVRVNGTPLDVGPDCRTVRPVDVVLHGRQDAYLPGGGDGKPDYTIQTGGPLAAKDLVIPAFTGCGAHGENLDALFTAAISGSGNSLNFVQGPLCVPTDDPSQRACPAPLPQLPHH